MARERTNIERLTEDVRTRVSPIQHARILAAARMSNLSPATFIRDAALVRAEQVLAGEVSAFEQLADFIGVLNKPVTRSARTGRGLVEVLKQRRDSERAR